MHPILKQLIEPYAPKTIEDYTNSLKETIQHLALLGLWRNKFYEHAALYGGTALRIFYGLNRFSEDLDFSLLKSDEGFSLEPHCTAIEKELASVGLESHVRIKQKSQDSTIESAFIKANTIKNFIAIDVGQDVTDLLPKTHHLKIKFELDHNPPYKLDTEVKTLLIPIPFQVRLVSVPDLFAGKVHAVLCRSWKTRIKGRDFYDFVWHVAHKHLINLKGLSLRMQQTGHLEPGVFLTKKDLGEALNKRFAAIDFKQAKQDVAPFIKDSQELSLWSVDFFKELIPQIVCC
ncbi:MAG: nucleotidyl transferase AbiEii/AbiGii toxin family protein [bacterium]|nr:nucleotidyl transferase AbiEii/AbiGii toxin family protein [bacterium]MBU1916839.1 nucleotidyl transferase AbiEii/AbiGii toxin family protein [bacterium]